MSSLKKDMDAVERNDNGLVETIYPLDSYNSKNEEEIVSSFEVNILKRLLGAVNLTKDAEDIVTGEYIIKRLNFTETAEEERIRASLAFELDRFPVMDIPRKIVEWGRAGCLTNHRFGGKDMQTKIIRAKSLIEVDTTRGMVRILPMPQWGEEGGVYAIKLLSDAERRSEIKLVLKYEEEGTYEYSEFITVKPSDLTYSYEGMAELKKHSNKLKKLMDYSPAGKEPLDYKRLYVALSYFNPRINVRTINSDKWDFEATYELIVRKVFEIGSASVGEDVFGDGFYILTTEELESVAKESGRTLKELIMFLKERDLLETDKDKKSRNQKTTTRNGIKNKYYCVLTSDRFCEQYDTYADRLSVSEDELKECEKLCDAILGETVLGLMTEKKSKSSKKAVIAW
jgi:hypothetical protein